MQRIAGAARRLGVPEKSIRTLLIDELADDVAEEILSGDYSAYEMTPQTVKQMLSAKPDEFYERLAGWHGDQLPEAIAKFAQPLVGRIPHKPPSEKGKTPKEYELAMEGYEKELASTKRMLEALGVTSHPEAQKHLFNHYSGKMNWGKFKALGELYELDVAAAKNEIQGPRDKNGDLIKVQNESWKPGDPDSWKTRYDTDFGKWKAEQEARWLEERKKKRKKN